MRVCLSKYLLFAQEQIHVFIKPTFHWKDAGDNMARASDTDRVKYNQSKHSVTEKLAHQKQMNGRPLHEVLTAQESIPLRVVKDGGTAYANHLKKHTFKLACDSLSLYGLFALLMAVLCGTAGNETRLIMWKITLAQTMSCQAIRWPRRLSAQFKRL